MTELLLSYTHARESELGVWVSAAIVLLVLVRATADGWLPALVRRCVDTSILVAMIVSAMLAATDAWENVHSYRPWDFPSFYSVAYAAVHGQAFYEPQVLRDVQAHLTATYGVPDEWLTEIGYWYLPPSLLTILPLGFLPAPLALVLHYTEQAIFLIAAAFVLHKTRPLVQGAIGWSMMLLLLLLFRPVESTIFFAQIVFGSLLFLVLAERTLARSGAKAGLSLAAGFFYKHLLLIPALILCLSPNRRHRGAGATALIAIGAALALSGMILGWHVFGEYAAYGPSARSPDLAIDPVVQSLLALLLRALHVTPQGSLLEIIEYPPFLIIAGIMTAVTVALLWTRGARDPESFWLISCLAIACYPNTLFSTLALVFPSMLGVYQLAPARGVSPLLAAGYITILYAVTGLYPDDAGWITVALWAALAMLIAMPVAAKRAEMVS